jgi:ABC-2 type transport system permease protein
MNQATSMPPGWLAATLAVARREAAALRASPWDLGMLSWIPLLICAVVWWTFSAGLARDLPIVLIDQDHSALSRSLGRMLDASPGLQVAAQVERWDEALVLLRERRAYGVLLVPEHAARELLGGRAISVQWFVNGQFQAHAGGMTRDVRTVVSTLSAGIELAAREKRGAAPVQAKTQFEPIRLQASTLFNDNASYEPFLTLALIPAVLQIFITLAAVTAVGRELKAGSVPEWLARAGGRWSAALAGKLLWPALAFGLQALGFVLFFAVGRGWSIAGSGAAIAAGLALLIAAHLALGLLLMAVTLTLRTAISGAAFITAPAFAFCGQGFPLLAMPAAAKAWALVLPLTHYLQIQSRHWLAGAPVAYSAADLAALLAMTLLWGGVALWLLRRRALQPSSWGRT